MWLKPESGILPPDGMTVNVRGYHGVLKQAYRTQGHWSNKGGARIYTVTAFELPDELALKLIAAQEADMNERIRAGRLKPPCPRVIRVEKRGKAGGARRSLDYWRLVLSLYDQSSGVYQLALRRVTGYVRAMSEADGRMENRTEPDAGRGYVMIRGQER